MSEVIETSIRCPYCGERILVMIDDSVPDQQYTEDCQVCCRPIVLDVVSDLHGGISVNARSENE